MAITQHEPGFPALFISAHTTDSDPSLNNANTELMAAYLRREGITFDRVRGCYKGVAERSFRLCLPADDLERALGILGVVRKLAAGFQQESWLAVRPDGKCSLFFTDHSPTQHIGWWHRVDAVDLDSTSDYSLVDGEYFQVIEV